MQVDRFRAVLLQMRGPDDVRAVARNQCNDLDVLDRTGKEGRLVVDSTSARRRLTGGAGKRLRWVPPEFSVGDGVQDGGADRTGHPATGCQGMIIT